MQFRKNQYRTAYEELWKDPRVPKEEIDEKTESPREIRDMVIIVYRLAEE